MHVLGWGTMNRCILCKKEEQEKERIQDGSRGEKMETLGWMVVDDGGWACAG